MKQYIESSLREASAALEALLRNSSALGEIERAAGVLVETFERKGRVFACGNGGSMCDAMHFAEELTGRYRHDRGALAATAISDAGHLTCVGNDLGYEQVFSRYLEAHGRRGDCLVALSTSGTSKNIVRAAATASSLGMSIIVLSGRPSESLFRPQHGLRCAPWRRCGTECKNCDIKVLHIFIELVERHFFPELPWCLTPPSGAASSSIRVSRCSYRSCCCSVGISEDMRARRNRGGESAREVMPRYVAFLRGVSPLNAQMPALKRAFEAAGFSEVRTLLSSGNVAFNARAASLDILQRRAEKAMRSELGSSFNATVRTAQYLQRARRFGSFRGVPPRAGRQASCYLPPRPCRIGRQAAHRTRWRDNPEAGRRRSLHGLYGDCEGSCFHEPARAHVRQGHHDPNARHRPEVLSR